MKLNECFYLNWEFCQLSGFENNKSLQCIEAIIRGINLNDKFPPVHVFQISPFSFSISGFHYVKTLQNETKIDAGHHRGQLLILLKINLYIVN